MIDDPIVEEIRRYRRAFAEAHGHDLERMCAALREREAKSKHLLVNRGPRLLEPRSGTLEPASG